MMAPCKDCKDRIIGCHAKCPKYLEFRAWLDGINHQKEIARQSEYVRPRKMPRKRK